jgi:uncharacterized protein involved in copper resistance
VIRYTPLRPFLVRMNDRGGGVDDLMPHVRGHRPGAASDAASAAASDAAVGGGSGGADHMNADHVNADHVNADHVNADHVNADHVNGQANAAPSTTAAFSVPDGRQPSADTRG